MNNAGLGGLPVGLDCTNCGKPITVDYIAHGDGSPEELTSDPMQDLAKAAARHMISLSGQQLCRDCSPPAPQRLPRRRGHAT